MGTGKRNAEIKKIERKSARYVCFSKRREGLFKKAQQYHTVSGSHIAVLVLSPCGRPYVHGSPSFDPIVDKFLQTSTTTTPTTGGSVSGPTVSESASTDVGLRECVEAIKVEECESLEELMEMKRKLEEIRGMVVQSFVDSFILEDF